MAEPQRQPQQQEHPPTSVGQSLWNLAGSWAATAVGIGGAALTAIGANRFVIQPIASVTSWVAGAANTHIIQPVMTHVVRPAIGMGQAAIEHAPSAGTFLARTTGVLAVTNDVVQVTSGASINRDRRTGAGVGGIIGGVALGTVGVVAAVVLAPEAAVVGVAVTAGLGLYALGSGAAHVIHDNNILGLGTASDNAGHWINRNTQWFRDSSAGHAVADASRAADNMWASISRSADSFFNGGQTQVAVVAPHTPARPGGTAPAPARA